jgi:hypothetical protein
VNRKELSRLREAIAQKVDRETIRSVWNKNIGHYEHFETI